MKKMMMMMALAMGFAFSAQAAQVTWTTGLLLDRKGNEVGYGQGGFTATVTFYELIAGDWVVMTVSGVTSSSTTNVITGDLRGTAGHPTLEFAFSTDYKVHVYVTSDAEPDWFVSQTTSFKTKGSGATTVNMAPLVWQQIPEPATMALLGIGIVAVGLRRRRK